MKINPELAVISGIAPSGHFYAHQFDSLETAPFNVEEYSRLKFGAERVAKDFGRELADRFFAENEPLFEINQCVVIPSPSTTVPVAATLMGHHLRNRLNERVADAGYRSVEWTMIHRNMAYNHNYACLGKEERKAILANDSRYVANSYLEGKHLLFVDDVTITGTHEEEIVHFMWRESLPNPHTFVTYARYLGDDPSIETRLNHVLVRDAADLVDLAISEPEHRITTRAVRLFLETTPEIFAALLDRAPKGFLIDAYHSAIVKGYHVDYPDTFALLRAKFD